jgi:division protein CdvB (Snf7/Vps24/ESCRT-III family)
MSIIVEDEEVDDVTNAVLDEIGLDVSAQMSKTRTPGGKLPTGQKSSAMEDKELQKLLESLP